MSVSSCCCGCSLEKGCKIIAILGLVFGTIGLNAAVINWNREFPEFPSYPQFPELPTVLYSLGQIPIIYLLSIVGNILGIIAAGVLLWGTLKKKDAPVLAYLIIQALSMITIVLVIGLAVLTSFLYNGSTAFDSSISPHYKLVCIIAIVIAVTFAIALGINVYFWNVVYSFYRQLKPGTNKGSQEWKQGICGCCGDGETCLCGACGAGCLIRRNADDLGKSGWLFCLLSCFCPCAAIFILRQEARERYGIEGSTAGDAMCSLCCYNLVACQTGAEIKERGDHC